MLPKMLCPICRKKMRRDFEKGGYYCVRDKVGRSRKAGCGYRWDGNPQTIEIKTYSEQIPIKEKKEEIIENRALSKEEIKKIDKLLGGI